MAERVWDRFLTERDRSLAATWAPERPEWRLGTKPALLYIDLYRGVFGDRPQEIEEAIADWPHSCGMNAWNSLPFLERLLDSARGARIAIVHVTGLPDELSGVAGWAAREGNIRNGRTITATERYEIMPQIAPQSGEAVIRKTTPSAFNGTPLMAHLNSLGIDSLIIGGESTSGCVRASVVDAKSLRFKVAVVEECVFDRHEAPHAVNLFDMHQKYADVVSLSSVVCALDGQKTSQAVPMSV